MRDRKIFPVQLFIVLSVLFGRLMLVSPVIHAAAIMPDHVRIARTPSTYAVYRRDIVVGEGFASIPDGYAGPSSSYDASTTDLGDGTYSVFVDYGHLTIADADAVKSLYQKILTLSAQPAQRVCPSYVRADYQMTFWNETSSMPEVEVSARQGGCSTITLAGHNIRAADASFWKLLDGYTQLNTYPQGLTPDDLQHAYHLPSASAGKNQTIAIIDAYDDPNAEADLKVYRSHFHLPACTTKNGCFQKVDGQGGIHYPHADRGWATEMALDLEMASAICPNCHLLLVEAPDASFASLGRAVETAIHLGAHIISASYGGQEDAQIVQADARYYRHPGVVITASSGDFGADSGIELPAAFNSVIAVGGTSLRPDSSARGWRETSWGGTGGGCSKYVEKPVWQHDSSCRNRKSPDVSAVANPDTGVAIYDSYGSDGWGTTGGTSVSSPIIAGVYALAGNAAAIDGSYLYSHAAHLNPLIGVCPDSTATVACQQSADAGLGTPNGVGAF